MAIESGSQVQSALPIVLILGDTDRAEMRRLVGWLRDSVKNHARTEYARVTAQVATALGSGAFPDLMVVLQGWSNEYSTADVDWLLSFAPLARVVVCYGAWCESDGRSHNLWPLALRVPTWSAAERIQSEWSLIQSSGEQHSLPWSASREEIFAANGRSISGREPQSILVDTPDGAYKAFLHESLTASGHTIVTASPTVLLFDGDPWGPDRAAHLRSLRAEHPAASILVLMSLPSPHDTEEIELMGGVKVAPKLGFY